MCWLSRCFSGVLVGVPSAMECLVEDRGLTFYHSSIIGDLDLLDGG